MNNKILSYLYENCFDTYKTSADTLMFYVDDSNRFIILISFEKDLKKNEDDETGSIGLSELGAFQDRLVKEITISTLEYLGDRDHLVDAERLPPSICFYLFSIFRELVNFSKESVDSCSTFIYRVVKEHNLSLNYGYGIEFCLARKRPVPFLIPTIKAKRHSSEKNIYNHARM